MYEMLRDMSPPLGLGKKCPPRIAYKVDLALFFLLLPPPSRLLLVSCCLLSNIFRLLSVSRSPPSGLLLCCSFCLSVLLSPRALGVCGGFTRGPHNIEQVHTEGRVEKVSRRSSELQIEHLLSSSRILLISRVVRTRFFS